MATLRDRAKRPFVQGRLRHPGHGLARRGAPLGELRDGLPVARGPGDAAGGLGAHGRHLRLRGRPDPRLARDDHAALLRGRRDLLGLRDGHDARDPAARALQARGLHHAAAPREHGQGDARDRPDRRYGYAMEAFFAWYSGNPYEQYMLHNRITGPYGWAYCAAALVQPGHAAAPLGAAHPPDAGGAVRDRDRGQRRHVARALRDRGHEPAPRLPALLLGHVRADLLGLGALRGLDRAVPLPPAALHPLPADDLDLRDAHARAGDGRGAAPRSPARPPRAQEAAR